MDYFVALAQGRVVIFAQYHNGLPFVWYRMPENSIIDDAVQYMSTHHPQAMRITSC